MQPLAPAPFPAADAPRAERGIQYMDALRFAFTIERPWTNILMSAVFLIIPMVGPIALYGWHAEIMQRLARRHPSPIPRIDFQDFSHYLSRGVAAFVVQMLLGLAVGLPVGLLFGVGGGVMAFLAAASGPGAGKHGDPTAMLTVMGLSMAAVMVSTPLISVLSSGLYTRAELTEDISETMKLGKLATYLRLTFLTTLVTYLAFGFIAFGMVLVGFIACYFGAFLAGSILQLAYVHLRWQIYEQYLARGGEPIPLRAPVVVPSEQRFAAPHPGGPPRPW